MQAMLLSPVSCLMGIGTGEFPAPQLWERFAREGVDYSDIGSVTCFQES